MGPRGKLILVLIPIGLINLILIISNIYLTWYDTYVPILNERKNILNLDGKLTSSNGNFSYIVDNNDKSSNKKLIIYGLENKSRVNLSFSKITDDTKNIYDISFCNAHLTWIQKLTFNKNATNPYQANLCFPEHVNPGIYQGLLFIKSKNNTSIPITFATDPRISVAIIWIIIGILTSMMYWEIMHYLDKSKEAGIAANQAVAQQTNLTNDTNRETFRKTNRNNYLDAYVTNRFLKSPTAPKISLIDIGTVVFGVVIGFLSLLGQGSVNGIRVFTLPDILLLLGLGLGVGSLRQLFSINRQ